MYKIICHFNLFDLHQKVILTSGDDSRCIAVTTLEELGEQLAAGCLKYNITSVHLFGNSDYAQSIIEDFDKHSNLAYSNKEIEIEVN